MTTQRRIVLGIGSLAILVLVGTCTGLIGRLRYSGDGDFSDAGWWPTDYRYKLDLGVPDLSQAGRYSYELQGLPPQEFVIGFQVAGLPRDSCLTRHHPFRPRVALEVINERREVVIADTSSLGRWTWSPRCSTGTGFLWRRGRLEWDDTPGKVRARAVGVRPDQGWGSEFRPHRRGRYRLTLTVLDASPPVEGPSIRLMVYGGAWVYP
jgi:hypothetical protein